VSTATVHLERRILDANDLEAQRNRALFDQFAVLALNIMASPGAGKTSVILATIAKLGDASKSAVIEGDLATRIDADRIAAKGIPVVQINTNGGCHLDAPMIRGSLGSIPVAEVDFVWIENVGNLVCPANFALGTHQNVVIASVPEGHDKPFKYPAIFAVADAVILNKLDLAPYIDFDHAMFEQGVRLVNPSAPIFPISCKTGDGFEAWTKWLRDLAAPRTDAA
jgi:hydrogenase nickel incorporation protein HypB